MSDVWNDEPPGFFEWLRQQTESWPFRIAALVMIACSTEVSLSLIGFTGTSLRLSTAAKVLVVAGLVAGAIEGSGWRDRLRCAASWAVAGLTNAALLAVAGTSSNRINPVELVGAFFLATFTMFLLRRLRGPWAAVTMGLMIIVSTAVLLVASAKWLARPNIEVQANGAILVDDEPVEAAQLLERLGEAKSVTLELPSRRSPRAEDASNEVIRLLEQRGVRFDL